MQELLKFPHEEFTVKRDFNMTGFLLNLKPDESFEVCENNDFKRTNSSSNIRLSSNTSLNEENVIKLISANRKTIVYYPQSKKMLCFNFGETFEEKFALAKKVGSY